MAEPVIRVEPGWRPVELRLRHTAEGTVAELLLACASARKLLRFQNPSDRSALIELFDGFDLIEVFDRDPEDGFHRDFGRYRIEYFIDDPCKFDADHVEVEDVA